MSEQTNLSEQDLHEIEIALQTGRLRHDERIEDWTRRMLGELKRHRGAAGGGANAAVEGDAGLRKNHGDALLDQSGSRHGADARRP
jgi:hypothetical protein